MINCTEGKIPVRVTKDVGFNKLELISSENRKKAKIRMNNPDIIAGNYKLKEVFAEIGIIVHPEKMTNWYSIVK